FEQTLVRLLRIGGILSLPLVSTGIDTSLRARVVHPVFAVLKNDVRRKDVLIVEFPLRAEREGRRLTVSLPLLRFEPRLKVALGGLNTGAIPEEQECCDY